MKELTTSQAVLGGSVALGLASHALYNRHEPRPLEFLGISSALLASFLAYFFSVEPLSSWPIAIAAVFLYFFSLR
jgi:uncharacterized RDD family membrane protein YckC